MKDRRIVLVGGSGFIGQALAGRLASAGYDLVILSRASGQLPAGVKGIYWDGRTLGDWVESIDSAHAVINLAGKNVNCRYTKKNLAEIDQSRIDAVTVIANAIGACTTPPKVLVQAATTAIYGDAGDRLCDETAPPGAGIPVNTATQWEQAFESHPTPHTRRVRLRISFALDKTGGALATLTQLTRRYLGGTVGHGRQAISWIHMEDLCEMFRWAVERDDICGVYNATSPHPVSNAEVMRLLRAAVGRPWAPPTPAWLVHVGSFFMRTEPVLALTGRRGVPKRFTDQGFVFKYPKLAEALGDLFP